MNRQEDLRVSTKTIVELGKNGEDNKQKNEKKENTYFQIPSSHHCFVNIGEYDYIMYYMQGISLL